jgi:cytochrome c-type biogenesis protein CcmH/NrfF
LKLETRNSKLLRGAQLLLIAVLAVGFMGADVDARFNKLGHQLMCMCGCNQVLLECNHVGCAYSERMRNELTAGLERGDSDSLVLQSFVQKYGNTVLAAPTSSGFNVIAWIMPFAVFAAASALTVWLVRLWKARPVAQPVARPNVGAEELDALRKKARQETEF